MRNVNVFLSFLLLLTACESSVKPTQTETSEIPPQEEILDSRAGIEEAHHKTAFREKEAIQFQLDLFFGGKQRVDARHRMTTSTSFIRMDYSDGKSLIGDGNLVLLYPDTADYGAARFDIYTWSYFFAIPYKLTDPGTNWEDLGNQPLNGKEYRVGKLSFNDGIGDAPDDWYMIYADPETGLVHAAAYIVTYSNSAEKAEEDPHAIVYTNYKEVDGIPLATEWSFHGWRADSGLTDTLGYAKVSQLEFISKNEVYPDETDGWREIGR